MSTSTLLISAASFTGSAAATADAFINVTAHAAAQVFKSSGDNPFPQVIASLLSQSGVNKQKATALVQALEICLPSLKPMFSLGEKLTALQKEQASDAGESFALALVETFHASLKAIKELAKKEASKKLAEKAAKEAVKIEMQEVPTITAQAVIGHTFDAASIALAIQEEAFNDEELLLIVNAVTALYERQAQLKAA